MKYEVKSIRIWSFLKINFFLNIFVGFMCGFLVAFVTASTLTVMREMPMTLPYGMDMPSDFPIGALFIIYPIMGAISCAVFLTVFEIIVIAFYNLFAKLTGGIELNLNAVAEVIPLQQPNAAQAVYQSPPAPSSPPPPPPPAPGQIQHEPAQPYSEPKSRGDYEPPKQPPPDEEKSRGDYEPPQAPPDNTKPE